jgi:hypothetical protein
MTTRNKELYDTFQLFYDNVSSQQAPGLTLEEISIYLSDAQNELVRTLYESYEYDERSRKAIVPLVNSLIVTPSVVSLEKIAEESVFYKLPTITDDMGEEKNAVLYVIYEVLRRRGSVGRCKMQKDVLLQPIAHDDFYNVYRNPFRYNERRGLRLDIGGAGDIYAEVVCKSQGDYFVRYVERPTPIILTEGTVADYAIDGFNQEREPVLDQIYDNVIVQAAATKAYQHYKS